MPTPSRSSPYRRSRDPFTAQSNLFRPHRRHIEERGCNEHPTSRPRVQSPRVVYLGWRRRALPPGPEALLRTGHQPRDLPTVERRGRPGGEDRKARCQVPPRRRSGDRERHSASLAPICLVGRARRTCAEPRDDHVGLPHHAGHDARCAGLRRGRQSRSVVTLTSSHQPPRR